MTIKGFETRHRSFSKQLQLKTNNQYKSYSIHSAECTWEPLANLGNDMVKEFETELKEKNKEKRRSKLEKSLVRRNSVGSSRKNSTDDETASDSRDSVDNAYGFDKGLEPETIIGATDANGSLEFLIKWRNCDDRELVPAKVANARCPQMVIRFYEQHFEWKTDGL